MPIFAALVVKLFGSLYAVFALILGRKVAVIASAVATISTATLALTAAVSAIVSPFLSAVPPGIGTAVWLVLPDNFGAITAAFFAVDSSLSLFAWYRRNILMTAQIAGA
ncbi:MAG: DUF5455 family protein [Proteobacteria bacterium]|nr:DUF5455 family protein [Pseudomonadota bacterium]MBS2023494.1 DUF5455 family protein [Deltaproteobacteria bacterium]